jgi:hypothetical protein
MWASALGLIALLCVLAIGVLAFSSRDDPYVVKVVTVTEANVCLKGAKLNHCYSRSDIGSLPASLAIGQCLVLQDRHPNTDYIKTVPCSS